MRGRSWAALLVLGLACWSGAGACEPDPPVKPRLVTISPEEVRQLRVADGRSSAHGRADARREKRSKRQAQGEEVEAETFWVWIPPSRSQQPTLDEAYWQDPSVFPLIQAHVDWPDQPGRNAPGARVPGIGTRYDDVDSWDGKNPEAAAEQMLGWTAWYRDQLASRGRGEFRYALWLNGFGAPPHGGHDPLRNRRNVWTLGRNPLDAVDAPISDRARVGVVFSEQGRALNGEWSRRYCERFDRGLESLDLDPPTALHFDFEGAFDLATVNEWWEPALADPRARTEKIDGRRTLRDWARDAPPFFPESGTFASRNRPFNLWILGPAMEATEFVLWEGFWRQAREVWPEVRLSNFQLTPATPRHPFPYEYLGSEIRKVRLRHATHASPVLYPLNDWAFENGRVTVADQLTRFGRKASGNARRDLNELNFQVAKARLDACLDNGMKAVPWIRPPDPQSLDMDRTAELIRYGRSRGVREWILWSPDAYDWSNLLSLVRERESSVR